MDITYKTIITAFKIGRWFTDREIATRAKMKVDQVIKYLKKLRRKGLVTCQWRHGERMWSAVDFIA
jgi:transcription initiation factor IIE alpha subunit|tara:strand:+ start:196 stop:393 length:198 start_codon:yes stop_codon:yes gene_type:complete